MLQLLVIGIFSIFLLYKIFIQPSERLKWMSSKIPGPKEYPIVGSALEFGKNSVEFHENMSDKFARFGSVFKMWMGPSHLCVMISDPKDIEAVLKTTTHLNKSMIYAFLRKWLGTGLITAPAEKWKIQRKVLIPAFHINILETYIDVFNANARIMADVLKKEIGAEKFDIVPYIEKCTLDVICETAMATSIHAQLNEESQFTKCLKVVSHSALVRAFKPWLFPEFTFNLSKIGREYNEHLEYINDYVDKVIAEKKKARAESQVDKSSLTISEPNTEENFYGAKKRDMFLDLLLKYADDPSVQMSDTDIRDEVNTFMFAGHDTTASTLGFALYLLASHPDIQVEVAKELHYMFGDSDRNPTIEELQSFKCGSLERVIKETLRIYPAVPYIGRFLYEDLELPSGYTIPAGTCVDISIYQLHRDPRIFPDPETFDPNRFSNFRSRGRFPFAYTPFSAGPRNCLGQKFAMLEMKAVLSRLLRTYRITAVLPKPVLAAELVLRSVTGINVRLEKLN